MVTTLLLAGLLSVTGMLIEGLGVLSMACYPVRRRIPMSPFADLSIGGCLFFGGVILFAISRYVLR